MWVFNYILLMRVQNIRVKLVEITMTRRGDLGDDYDESENFKNR